MIELYCCYVIHIHSTIRSASAPRAGSARRAQAGPWEDIEFPSINDDSAYAIELDRDLVPPILRAGDMLIISPKSSVRRHDRIVLRRRSGDVEIGVLRRRTAQRISLGHFLEADGERSIDAADVAWLSRILWISQ